MRKVVDARFFEQPGYAVLDSAWIDILQQNSDGSYALDPVQAIALWSKARSSAIAELGDEHLVDELDRIASRNAREIKMQLEEALYA